MRRKRLPSAAETGGGQVADAPERCSVPDGSSDDDFRKECRRTWARMIKKIYEVDPLICPRCGFPMRVLSVIEDPPVVRRILDHLGLWDAEAAPSSFCW